MPADGPGDGIAADPTVAQPAGSDGLLEAALDDLRRRWRRGERDLAADYPERHPALRSAEAVAALLYQEFLLRGEAGEDVSFDDYLRQFPQYAEPLRRLRQADTLLESALLPQAAADLRGVRVGDYELLEEIDRGGMGVVYRARQLSLGRTVALKMILGGGPGSAAGGRRLRNEAEAAARLQHPGIVAIYEVGEWQGQPFFSMEHVAGTTLAALVREHPLPAARAAHYVEAVARAVQHAHENGVLHRDLKPSNVLIGADDRPRVTDFGLARQARADDRLTATGEVLGTPNYMPPEQASDKHGPVGAASDVYALGAVLYELLTGRPPFQAETRFDTLLLVLHNDPVPPSRLNPKVPRDLETVCLKCLHKEPLRRYPTAAALAEDLGRFRRGEPVRARPVGAGERAARWCRRNRAVTALVAGLFLALTTGLAVSLSQWWRADEEATRAQQERDAARAERERAEANLDRADEAVERMLRHLGNERLAEVPQATPVRRDLLLEARQLYQSLLQQKSSDPRMRARLGAIHGQLAHAQASLGQTDEALASLDEAIRIFRELSADYPDRPDYRRELAGRYGERGGVLRRSRSTDAADAAYREAQTIRERLVAEDGAQPGDRLALAVLHVEWCDCLFAALRYEDGERHARRALELLEQLLKESPEDVTYRGRAAAAHNVLAIALKRTNRRQEARGHYEEALALQQRLYEEAPQESQRRAALGVARRNLALLLRDSAQLEDARRHYQEARALFEGLAADFPDMPGYHAELAEVYNGLAICARLGAKDEEARDYLQLSVRHQRATLAADPRHRDYGNKMSQRLVQLADVQLQLGAYQEAAASAYEARLFVDLRRACEDAAATLVRCADVAARDSRLPPAQGRELAERYAAQAVAVLRAGAAKGLLSAANLNDLKLNRLEGRPDYRDLLRELAEARGGPPPAAAH